MLQGISKFDPTRTGTAQRLLERDILRRLRAFQKQITKLVAIDDAFGLREPVYLTGNAFCATGSGGGVDPTCGKGGRGGGGVSFKKITGRDADKEKGIVIEAGALVKKHLHILDTEKIQVSIKAKLDSDAVGTYAGGFLEVTKLGRKGFNESPVNEDDLYHAIVHELVHAYQEQSGLLTHPKGKRTFLGVTEPDNYHHRALEAHARFAEGYINARRKVDSGKMTEDTFSRYFHPRHLTPEFALEYVRKKFPQSFLSTPTTNLRAASTQVNITAEAVVAQILDIQNLILPDDLVKYEEESHVTIRYGLDGVVTAEQVAWIAKQYKLIRLKLGGLSLFQNEKEDVLKISVDSPDLQRINSHLGILPNTKTFDQYTPHLTVAYLKPGTGKKYVGRSGLEGTELVFESIAYSDVDRKHTELALNVYCATGKGKGKWMHPRNVKTSKLTGNSLTTNTVWKFLTTDQKLQEFMNWVKTEIAMHVLAKYTQLGSTSDDHWLSQHIERVFKKGMERAFDAIKKSVLTKMDFYLGSKEQFLRDSFFRPVSQERVKLLAARSFNELQGVTDAMATQIQRTATDSFIRGDSPYDMARALVRDVDNMGKKQAQRIARTEVVRAHNEGQLEAMENLGVEEVGVAVEWSTSGLGVTKRGNPSPCRLCAPLKGVVFTIKEAHGKLPRHPHCMCSWIPANVGERTTDQIRTRERVQAAIDRSVRAELRPKSKMTLAQQKRKSNWFGAARLARAAPKSIISPRK